MFMNDTSKNSGNANRETAQIWITMIKTYTFFLCDKNLVANISDTKWTHFITVKPV